MKILFLIAFLFFIAPAWSQVNKTENVDNIIYKCQPCNLPCDTIKHSTPGTCEFCGMPLFPSYASVNPTKKKNDELNKTVAILLFPGVEIIDFAGPYEVFWAAGARVFTVAESTEILKSGTLQVKPDYSFDNMPKADIIVLPGGNVKRDNPAILAWLKNQDKQSEKIMSVCNGAFYLSSAGLLDGLTATTFFSAIPSLRASTPKAKVVEDQRYVNNGHIITSAGLSSGIDAALFVVSEYIGIGATQQLATLLEYKWNYDNGFVRAQLADRFLTRDLDVFSPFPQKVISYTGDNNHWEVKLSVDTELIPGQLMKLMELQFTKAKRWKQLSLTDQNGKWEFKDKDQPWNYDVSIVPDQALSNIKNILLSVSKIK